MNQIKVNLDITDRQVKKETGFKTRNMLLAFTIIACHGDMAEVIHTTTKHLTWFEEWYLFYENLWGRTIVRGDDVAEKWNVAKITKNIIINNKLKKILICRESWGMYCSHEEDVELRGL